MQLQLEDGINLRVAEAEGAAGSGFDLRGALEAVLAAIQLYPFEFFGFAVLGDRDVLFREIFEQVFLGFRAAGAATDDADDVIEMIESNLIPD
jgi:hypothetical protein